MGSRINLLFLVMLIVSCTLADGRSFSTSDNVAGDKVLSEGVKGVISLTIKKNQQLCELCEQFAMEALFYLNKSETQAEIMNTLHQACSRFYYFEQECTKMVEYYVPLFFTKIASLSPEEFCETANLCEDVTVIRLPTREDACSLCHQVVGEILTGLEDPDMELKIIEILLKGCNVENFVQQCKKLIIRDAPLVIEYVKNFLKTRDICSSIHVCEAIKVHPRVEVISTA